MNDKFLIKTAVKPSFVSTGFSFLLKPKFSLARNLIIPLSWEIKCIGVLPEILITVEKVMYGRGVKCLDLSTHFSLPAKMEFPETRAVDGKISAIVVAECELKLIDIENVPFGQFRLIINLEFLNQKHEVFQNFMLIK